MGLESMGPPHPGQACQVQVCVTRVQQPADPLTWAVYIYLYEKKIKKFDWIMRTVCSFIHAPKFQITVIILFLFLFLWKIGSSGTEIVRTVIIELLQ